MAGNLPDLCLHGIFNHLNDDDKTLYSCTFVNKRWSYSSIPVLWANPFELIKNLELFKPLLDTYFSFLPQNHLQKLEIKPRFNRNTMSFNYPVFFRHMNLLSIFRGIEYWCQKEPTYEEESYDALQKEVQICEALVEYLFIHSSKIDTLVIRKFSYFDILNLSGSRNVLSKVHTLIFDNELFANQSSTLSNLNQNFRSLTCYFEPPHYDSIDSLKQLIRSQKNLIDITISEPQGDKLFPMFWEIFHSSINVTSTITFIEFEDIQFPRNIALIYHLSSFTNLQYLKFNGCDLLGILFKEDQLIQEINSCRPLAFKKLNTIIIIETPLTIELLKILLQLSGEELRCLELLDMKIAKFNYIIKWLEVFCLKLRRLVVKDPSNKLEIVRIQDFFLKFDNLPYVIINGEKFTSLT
ncbi:3557_t:CDS:1 [Funneliformis geosporum]|uniref:17880_t:CDS:1 n=1 Tax=Funneliformis geosporum TaxID=1117311 RepID=A0A9W4T967_9GLOM|nr:3557_t:CDS:1 [Funneliformis geosporum]CAI2196443.1 17880_t:CDS:1 [Funneliformis geosporum]